MGTATLESIGRDLTDDRRRRYLQLPRVQRRKERMTIGVGFKKADGIVLATDAQYTSDLKRQGEKIFDLQIGDELKLCITGAANLSVLIKDAARLLGERLPPLLQSANDFLGIIEGVLGSMHKKHVYRYVGTEINRPSFDLLIGAWSAQVGLMLVQTTGTVAELLVADYGAVGTGSVLARYVIDTLGQVGDSVDDVKYLALCAVKAAKDYDPNCGKGTQSRVLRVGGQIDLISPGELMDAESYFDGLWSSVGLLLAGLSAKNVADEDIDILTDEFKKGIMQFRDKEKKRKRKRRRKWKRNLGSTLPSVGPPS
jgi:20S proteasome alpha/beta subunit